MLRMCLARVAAICAVLIGVGCDDPVSEAPAAVAIAAPVEAPPDAGSGSGSGSGSDATQSSARVVRLSGDAEVRHGDGAKWRPLVQGDRLLSKDAIRTGEDGVIELEVNEIKVRVFERSDFGVNVLTQTAVRAKVRGRVESDVPEGRGTIEIQAEGSDAVVESSGGRFAMTADGRGVVAVATVSGGVKFSAKGRSVNVAPGQLAAVRAGAAPDQPKDALSRVLLAVNWPDQRMTNKRKLPVAGRVEVGSRVLVQGRPVEVKEDGTFNTNVALRNGKQKVSITVVDVLGRKTGSATVLELDERAPNIELKEKPW